MPNVLKTTPQSVLIAILDTNSVEINKLAVTKALINASHALILTPVKLATTTTTKQNTVIAVRRLSTITAEDVNTMQMYVMIVLLASN